MAGLSDSALSSILAHNFGRTFTFPTLFHGRLLMALESGWPPKLPEPAPARVLSWISLLFYHLPRAASPLISIPKRIFAGSAPQLCFWHHENDHDEEATSNTPVPTQHGQLPLLAVVGLPLLLWMGLGICFGAESSAHFPATTQCTPCV